MPRLEEFKPEMIFISAGFDAHREDDMGQLGLVEQRLRLDHPSHQGRGAAPCQGSDCELPRGRLRDEFALSRSVEAHIRVLADV
jgi:acetoin utilization deacetylase AcuC-like enzyme